MNGSRQFLGNPVVPSYIHFGKSRSWILWDMKLLVSALDMRWRKRNHV